MRTLSFSEINSIQTYLQQINKFKPLTQNEEVALAQKIKKGDSKAKHKLINSNLKFVVSVALNYTNQGMLLPDLINEGNLGLIKASERFDERKNFKFVSYAVWWIRQSILKALAQQSRIINIPLNTISDISNISKIKQSIEQEKERKATIFEITSKLKNNKDNILTLLQANSHHVSLNQPINKDFCLIDTLMSEDNTEQKILNQDERERIKKFLKKLKENEQKVLKLYFGIDQEECHYYTLEEIGQHLNVTKERVRQIKEKALKKLKNLRKLEEWDNPI
jgi:RNA polymerase primary sigma factor